MLFIVLKIYLHILGTIFDDQCEAAFVILGAVGIWKIHFQETASIIEDIFEKLFVLQDFIVFDGDSEFF